MNPSPNWNEILAAFADGEFEGRDDLAFLKQRVEEWLARHPEAQAELSRLRQLKQVWQQTPPPSPRPEVWLKMLAELEAAPHRSLVKAIWHRRLVGIASAAACIALVASLWWAQRPGPVPNTAPNDPDDVAFSVAAAHEVEIMNVDGADTHTLVVGELPVKGPLELAAPGEVTVTSVQPAARDNMMPEVNMQGPGRPMIWARLETD